MSLGSRPCAWMESLPRVAVSPRLNFKFDPRARPSGQRGGFSVSTLWSRPIDFCCYARSFEARAMRPAKLLALFQSRSHGSLRVPALKVGERGGMCLNSLFQFRPITSDQSRRSPTNMRRGVQERGLGTFRPVRNAVRAHRDTTD